MLLIPQTVLALWGFNWFLGQWFVTSGFRCWMGSQLGSQGQWIVTRGFCYWLGSQLGSQGQWNETRGFRCWLRFQNLASKSKARKSKACKRKLAKAMIALQNITSKSKACKSKACKGNAYKERILKLPQLTENNCLGFSLRCHLDWISEHKKWIEQIDWKRSQNSRVEMYRKLFSSCFWGYDRDGHLYWHHHARHRMDGYGSGAWHRRSSYRLLWC